MKNVVKDVVTQATSLLKRNPLVLSKYVSFGLLALNKAVAPLNSFMLHLMSVQDIDPNTQPGLLFRTQLLRAFDADKKTPVVEYDDDFDHSKFKLKFKEVSQKLEGLNLTAESFRDMTDLENLTKPTPVEVKTTVENTIDDAAISNLREAIQKIGDLVQQKEESLQVTKPVTTKPAAVRRSAPRVRSIVPKETSKKPTKGSFKRVTDKLK